ncbi:MAG: hypothetical protein AAF170_16580 [Bacteroidota bacterium]
MDALTIPTTGWHPSNVRRVRRALDVSLRNEEIRAAYHSRGEEKPGACIERLRLAYCLSYATVERIVFPRTADIE